MRKRVLCLFFTTILAFTSIVTAFALSVEEYNNLNDEQRKWYNKGNDDGFESGYESGYEEGYYQKEFEYESEQETNEEEEEET